LFGSAFQQGVSFRPEQDGILVLRSGETSEFRDVGRIDLLTGRVWRFAQKKYDDLSTPLIRLAQGFGRDDTFSVLSKIEEPVDPDGRLFKRQ